MSPRISVRVITIVAAGVVFLQSGFGQGRGGGSTTGGGSTGPGTSTGTSPGTGTSIPTTGTRPTLPSTNPTTTTTNPQPAAPPQPIYISGRVLLEDGTPPTDTVVIERVCGASPHAEGYVDSKGYFGIQLGQNNAMVQDASENSGFGGTYGDPSNTGSLPARSAMGGTPMGGGMNPDMRFMNCELRARLTGYRSQVVSLAGRRAMDNPDIGIILLHRLTAVEGTTISTVSLAAPKDAHKAFEKGQDALKRKKPEEAYKNFQKAVDLYPEYAVAWYELGRLQGASGALDTAHISFECAVKADPKYVAPYVEIAQIDAQARKWKEVASITDRAGKLDTFDYPEVPFLNAVAHYNLKNFDAAEKSARQAERLDTRHRFPQSSYLLGMILAIHRDFPGAVEELRTYLKLAPNAADAPSARTQLDRIEKLTATGNPPAPKRDQ